MSEQQMSGATLEEAVRRMRLLAAVMQQSVKPLERAFQQLRETMQTLGRQLSSAWRKVQPHAQAAARAKRGGSGDPYGLWQSSPCAGWLHESCPTDPLLDCRCTCHGGEIR